MIYLLSMLFVLSVLIFVHEFGHFLAAKLFGVRVERFSIGFPPRLFGIQIGETDYCISAVPFGGYVKLSGMIDESLDQSNLKGEPYEFMSKPAWQKLIILSAGVIMNFLLAIVILAGLLFSQGEQLLPTTIIGTIGESGLAQKIGFQKYDRILAVNGEEVQYWNDITDKFINKIGSTLIFTVERNGQIIELKADKALFREEKSEQLDIAPLFPARVGDLSSGFPAMQAGLKTGDEIVAINDQPIESWEDMTRVVRENPGKPLTFTIKRGQETLAINITPQAVEETNENGETITVGKIGIGPYFEHRKIGLLPSVVKGFENSILISKLNIKGIVWVITGQRSAKEILGGPIMITKMAGDFAKTGFLNLLMLVAQLSIVLAIVNILPIPALDGGHLAIILVEGIRRRPLSLKTKVAIQQVGMALILVLTFFLIFNDIRRFL